MNRKLINMLTEHEGRRLKMYQDSEGIWTIGVGHNLEEKGISEAVCDLMLEEDLQESIAEANTFRWFADLNEPRQAVIIDMIFNLGLPRFKGFKKTIQFLENQLYQSAAKEMLDSKWARQVGARATRLSEIMRTGEWDDRALEWD